MNEAAGRIWLGRPARLIHWNCPECNRENVDNLGSAYAFFNDRTCMAEGLPCFYCESPASITFRITVNEPSIMTGIVVDEVRSSPTTAKGANE